MTNIEELTNILQQEFSPHHLEIIDQSSDHEGHGGWRAGQLTHIRIIMQAKALEGLSSVQKQRLVYRVLNDFMQPSGTLHAISMAV